MYFKVALFLIPLAIFTGCSTKAEPKPTADADLNNTVVAEESEVSTPIVKDEVKVKEPKKNKYNLKPEPFSLESNEDDPELLGPQTTLGRDAISKNSEEDIDSDETNTEE